MLAKNMILNKNDLYDENLTEIECMQIIIFQIINVLESLVNTLEIRFKVWGRCI